MNVQRYRRLLVGSAAIVLLSCPDAAAQQQLCTAVVDMENQNRHVVGEVNVECGGISIHSATWGNWGVSSNMGNVTNSAQFFGWHTDGGQAHWNSCTGDHNRDEDATYYNHDHNGNGFGDDQFSPYVNPYVYDAFIQYPVECPFDWNSDGQCDTGGCLALNYGAGVTGQFLSLYELDAPDGDDFITTLYVDGGCCGVFPSCTAHECGPATSSWWPTTSYTNTEAYAEVRLKMQYAVFQDLDNHCEQLKLWDSRYQCY